MVPVRRVSEASRRPAQNRGKARESLGLAAAAPAVPESSSLLLLDITAYRPRGHPEAP